MKRIALTFLVSILTLNLFAQSYDCPADNIGGLPADNIYTVLSSNTSGDFVSAQAFVNFDSLSFKAISVIGLRENGNWETCTDQTPPTFKVDFWTYDNLLPGTIIESIDDAYLTIDSLDLWEINDQDWVLEKFTFSFSEARNYPLGFISIYSVNEAPNNTCRFHWMYNHPDNINLEGATIHDDGTKVIWNAFNFCLLPEGIMLADDNIEKGTSIKFYPNPFNDFLQFENSLGFEKIEIYNSLGVLCLTKKINNSSEKELIQLSQLPPGSYVAKLIDKDLRSVSQVIVK